MAYVSGDHYISCASCGFKILKSEALKDSEDHKWYCKKDWDDLHPNDRPFYRPHERKIPAHLIRPDSEPTINVLGIWELTDLQWDLADVAWNKVTTYTYEDIKDTL